MEAQHNIIDVLRSADRPAFLVSGGVIRQANDAALKRMVPVGQPIEPMLVTGREEYAGFREGWLGLSIRVDKTEYNATIHPFGTDQIFTIELGEDDARLQALSLAAVELRKPLSNIMAITDQLFPKLDAADDRQLAQINRGLAQLQRIVGNMSGAAGCYRACPNLEVRNVDDVLRELFEQTAALCEEAGVQLTYAGLHAQVYSQIDADRLERCVYNIISNALKYTPRGGSIRVALTRRGNTLYLTVQDSGSGLSGKLSGSLFGQYRRDPGIEADQGLGLGMRLIHSCAAIHGGTVLLGPGPEQGLKLTVSLPIRLGDTQLRSFRKRVDYAGERNHGLIELSESLPWELYKPHRK